MPGRIIPKETLSSYQCWKMEAFERRQRHPAVDGHDDPRGAEGKLQPGQETPGEENSGQSGGPPTLEGYEPGYEAGQQAGYEAGYEESRNAGYQAGYEAGCKAGYSAGVGQAAAEAHSLGTLLQEFQRELSVADQVIGQDLLSLALGLAQQMTREALRVKPELVGAVVRECIRQEPAFGQPAQLFLNPEDVALLQQHLGQELDQWSICVDPRIQRGGCRIKVGHGETDATINTRWQRIAQVLGQSAPWME